MGAVEPVDIAVLAILAIALLRGVFRGLIREVFSIAALGGACVAVRLFAHPLASWLETATGGEMVGTTALWLSGAVLAVGTIALVVIVGRVMRRGVRWSGLGWADRAAGAVLGAAEGVLVIGILLAVAASFLGRGHPVLADTRSLAALEQLERVARDGGGSAPDVAAPPR